VESSDVTIWRYIDLAKFVSMLAEEALYFACPSELRKIDPYEGYLPRSHLEALSRISQEFVDDLLQLRTRIATLRPDANLQKLDDGFTGMEPKLRDVLWQASQKFGVSCWHQSEYESEALWRLYAGGGVCIESTVRSLTKSLGSREGLTVESVRYADFENDPIEKGHKHHALLLKRNSFKHEKELRATIPLKEPGKGQLVPCNLHELIIRIHVSPFAEPHLQSAVERLCAGRVRKIEKPVHSSKLLDEPDYRLRINLPPDLKRS